MRGIRTQRSHFFNKMLSTLLTVLLAGCLSACNPKAIPTVIFPAKPDLPVAPSAKPAVINIFARDTVNPDINGNASPIQVRVFVSDDENSFAGVSFEEMFEFGGQEFKVKPLSVKTINPGSVANVRLEILPEHKVIAVAAAFQDIGRSKWLEQLMVEDLKLPSVNIVITDYAVNYEK